MEVKKCLIKHEIIKIELSVTININGYERSEIECPLCGMRSDFDFYHTFHPVITVENTFHPPCFE